MIFDQRMNFPSHPDAKKRNFELCSYRHGKWQDFRKKLQLFHLRRLPGRGGEGGGGGKGIKIRISEAFIII